MQNRKSRNTWSNRQMWPWSTEWSRAKANGVLPRKCTGHSKHRLPTTQEKTLHMDITRWSTPKSDWLYSLQPKIEKLYIVSKNKTGSWLWLRSWTPYCHIQTEIEESRENQGEGNGNPLQCSCLENPWDGGAWWAAICGVAQSRTRLKWLSSSSSSRENH